MAKVTVKLLLWFSNLAGVRPMSVVPTSVRFALAVSPLFRPKSGVEPSTLYSGLVAVAVYPVTSCSVAS